MNIIQKEIYQNTLKNYTTDKYYLKKIIATTDESLGLPRPSNEFLKKYCELGGIDEILIELESCKTCKDSKRFIVSMFGEVDCYYCQKLEGYEKHYNPSKLKVAPDNTITIKPIKDSWSKEEIIELCWKSWRNGIDRGKFKLDLKSPFEYQFFENWIKENL